MSQLPETPNDLVDFCAPTRHTPTGRPFPCNLCRQGTLRLQWGFIKRKRLLLYRCDNPDCDAMISAHQADPYHPLGVPADKKTRQLRAQVHKAIDGLWQEGDPSKRRSRRKHLYKWLSIQLNLRHYHTADLDEAGCRKVIALVQGKTHLQFEAPPEGPRTPSTPPYRRPRPKRNET